jgi:hypothetical protein
MKLSDHKKLYKHANSSNSKFERALRSTFHFSFHLTTCKVPLSLFFSKPHISDLVGLLDLMDHQTVHTSPKFLLFNVLENVKSMHTISYARRAHQANSKNAIPNN